MVNIETYWKMQRRAHKQVELAKRRGDIKAPDSCENCYAIVKLYAHHDDYEHPLVVRWLCRPCHRAVHPGRKGKAEASKKFMQLAIQKSKEILA